jgi:hypothetical protein
VTSASPSSGPTTGTTSVTIAGTDLSGATAVNFGSTPGTISSDTDSQIVATSPSAAAGTVDITVTTVGGTSSTFSADHSSYTQAAPVVASISPGSGPIAGGTTVTVSGTSLAGAAVSFGATAGTILRDSAT